MLRPHLFETRNGTQSVTGGDKRRKYFSSWSTTWRHKSPNFRWEHWLYFVSRIPFWKTNFGHFKSCNLSGPTLVYFLSIIYFSRLEKRKVQVFNTLIGFRSRHWISSLGSGPTTLNPPSSSRRLSLAQKAPTLLQTRLQKPPGFYKEWLDGWSSQAWP